MSRRGLWVRGRAKKLFFKFSHRWALSDPEIFYPALADRWPTAFQRVGAEHWVIHGPCLLRPELCQATPRLTRYGDTRFTRGTASGRGGRADRKRLRALGSGRQACGIVRRGTA